MDLSHGHPSSLPSYSDRRSQQLSHIGSDPKTPSPLSSHSYDPPFSLQNRRLHLRNAGFRGPRLSSQRLGVKISKLLNGTDTRQSEQVPSQNSEESSTLNRSSNKGRSAYRPSTTFGILQEISNSTRNRYSQKRLDIPIAEDNPERPLLDFSPPVVTPGSWYHDAPSTQQSPLTFHSTDADFDTMRLREISGNERRSPPPLSSPLARQVRGRKKRAIDLRKTTFGASEYIEHIENELQEIKEAMHSPNTGKPLQDKLKNLQAENKQLKESIFELEETFDERVKQAVEHKAAVEVDLRRKIKTLEDELVLKENVISDLEHDREEAKYDNNSIDALRAMIERLEQEKDHLEEANRVVGKRNEALTGLLAQSPTRSHHGFELASPIRPDSRRTPRPKSMMIPKLSSSPSTENYQRPQSVQVSPAQSSMGFFSLSTALKLEDHHHSENNTGGMDAGKVSDSDSLDSGIGESCSLRSPARGSSRRSSTASHVSASPSAWGLPLPSSPSNDKATVKQGKHRRTRRFESGSTQLKPLLLPTMAAEGNASYTTYTSTSYSSPTHREFLQQSFDPTGAFLSQPFGAPIQCPALPSKRVSERALKALEGSSPPHFESFEEILAQNDSKLAVLGSSPTQNEMPDQSQDLYWQESDSPSCVDDTIVEGDFPAFLASQEPRATDEQMFSSLNDQKLPTASDQDRPCSPELDPAPSKLQLTFGLLTKHQQSTGIDLCSDYTPLRQMSAVSSQELMPEPLFLPRASFGTSDVPRLLSRSSLAVRTSYDVDNSPIPCKRQRSSDPDGRYFVMPKLCINPTHHTCGHEEHLPVTHVGSKASTDIGLELRSMKLPSRPRSPLERLHQVTASPVPLTSVTIRTIFGTLSRCTSYVREIRRDPTALARRVIANAWHSHWKRLGKLSWWVLGLFLGPSARAERLGGAQESGWDWDQYDGGAIAGQVCGEEIGAIQHDQVTSSQDLLWGPFNRRMVRFDESDPGYRTEGTKAKAKPALKQGADQRKREKTSWGKSLYLWGKFSVAILLAVGGAVINGPEEMLRDCAEHVPGNPTSATYDEIAAEQKSREVHGEEETAARGTNTPGVGTSEPATASESQVQATVLSSEARNASGVSARSLSGAGAGPTLGVVKLGRSSLKTPSPARRRRQALVSDLAMGNAHTLGSAFGSEAWDRSDDNGIAKAVESRTINDEQPGNNVLHARPDREHGDVSKLQWVQNLNITDFQKSDDQEEPVRFHGESSKRRLSMMN